MADRQNGAQSPEQQVRALYEEAESNTAKVFEALVNKPSFGRLLALSAENTAALTRMSFDGVDLLWRNLRLAGRADIVRLSKQLHRTEDKLERVLQEVESCATRLRVSARPSSAMARVAVVSVVDPFVGLVDRAVRFPVNALEYTNILLTTDDAVVGATPREVVWTHRQTTLYRYRSSKRRHAVPLLLVFALINRPEIFDLRPGSSLVEYLIDEGFDVFLVDWGHPDEEDADMGLDEYVCDELDWAVRETLRASGAEELSLMGWCIGATLCAMYCGLRPRGWASAGEESGAADDADRRTRLELRQLGRGRATSTSRVASSCAARCPAARSTSPTR